MWLEIQNGEMGYKTSFSHPLAVGIRELIEDAFSWDPL
jgi:hypothetical protein